MVEEQGHTRIRVDRPGNELEQAAPVEEFDLAKAPVQPTRSDPRYTLSLRTLGRLERLAKARFLLAEKEGTFDSSKLDPSDSETVRSVALSVFASSEIEGEGVSADFLEPFVAALTEPGERVDTELVERLSAQKDIIEAYFWAINKADTPVLSYEFVLEAHRRMFHRSKAAIAGRIKERAVNIYWRRANGTQVEVPTVPPERSEQCLRALCQRTSTFFRLADEAAEAPMLLAAGEFASDFLAIHPFADGNGRTARLLSTYLLERGGYHFTRIYPLDQVVLDSRADYYEALNSSQQNWHSPAEDLTRWIEYFVLAVFEQWERAFRRIRERGQPAR